jgi:hypothetical protein
VSKEKERERKDHISYCIPQKRPAAVMLPCLTERGDSKSKNERERETPERLRWLLNEIRDLKSGCVCC